MHEQSARDGMATLWDALLRLFYAGGAEQAAHEPTVARRGATAWGKSAREHAPHVRAPVVCRPAGLRLFAPADRRDPRVPRVAIYSDDPLPVGERLELEVFGADASATLTARVDQRDTRRSARRACGPPG